MLTDSDFHEQLILIFLPSSILLRMNNNLRKKKLNREFWRRTSWLHPLTIFESVIWFFKGQHLAANISPTARPTALTASSNSCDHFFKLSGRFIQLPPSPVSFGLLMSCRRVGESAEQWTTPSPLQMRALEMAEPRHVSASQAPSVVLVVPVTRRRSPATQTKSMTPIRTSRGTVD